MASRLQDVLLRGLAAAKPLATAVAPGTLYYSTDLSITERCADSGLVWESYSDAGSGIALPHAATHGFGGSDPVTLAESQVTNLVTDLAAKAPLVHATRHLSAGPDPLSVLGIGGYPGGTATFLRADATFAVPPATTIPPRFAGFEMIVDGSGSVITTGFKGFYECPFAGTILGVTLLGDLVGSIVMDIWKSAYAAYPPTVANTITAAAKPTISAAIKSQDTTLTGWALTFAAGDILGFNVDSVTAFKRVTLSLRVQA